MRSICYLAAALLPLITPISAVSSRPKVTIKNGTIIGVHSAGYNQDFFLGIPYARPPTGSLRYRPAQPQNESLEGFEASSFSPICPQLPSPRESGALEISEDCLTINIVRPSKSSKDLPVAVWIYGGGFVQGGSGNPKYNLSFLVEEGYKTNRPFIGVSLNYRVGAWGFLHSREVKNTGNANLGIRDVRLALHWIRENIAAFGGNPEMVTIWGESAGAAAVGAQLIAYGGRDDKIFSAAVMESGGPIHYGPLNDTDKVQQVYDAITERAGCRGDPDSLECLRRVPYTKLNDILNSSPFNDSQVATFNPIVDGDFIQIYPSQQIASGHFVRCPIIIGCNSDEGGAFGPRVLDGTPFEQVIRNSDAGNFLPESSIKKLAEVYPPHFSNPSRDEIPADTVGMEFPQDGPEFKRLAAYWGDFMFIASKRRVAERYSAFGVPTYAFRFNAFPSQFPRDVGTGHFTEVGLVFRNLDGIGYDSFDSPVNGTNLDELAKDMSSRWISFFHSHDPNKGAKAKVSWPKYSQGAENIVFQVKPQKSRDTYIEKDDFRKEGIAFINNIALQYGR